MGTLLANLVSCTLVFLAIVFRGSLGFSDIETTTVLPEGILSPKFIYGTEQGLEEKFNSVGLLEGVASQYHFNLTGQTLARLDPRLAQLVETLNHYSPNEALGNQLTLGQMEFNAAPIINFFVPELTYGLTPNFSIGMGIPIIHFQNTIHISSSGGNLAALQNYVNNSNPQVTQAMSQLVQAANDLTGTLNGVLTSKGYLPIRNIDTTVPGDLQISGVYRYVTSRWWRLALRPYIQFPTGHKHNPSDLMDEDTGGQPAVGLYTIHDLVINHVWSFVSSLGYQANIQDSVDLRVPDGSDDLLPGPDRQGTVRRKTGNSIFAEGGVAFNPWRALEVRALYDFSEKDPDWYDGDRGWNYGYLSQDTGSLIHSIHVLAELSSVDWFKKKLFSVPFLFGYIFGNTVYAVNAPNQVTHQLYLRMFF